MVGKRGSGQPGKCKMEFFTVCSELFNKLSLAGWDETNTTFNADRLNETTAEALAFLRVLRYIPSDVATAEQVATFGTQSDIENHSAILKIASRFSRAFQLPLPHAPGAYFFGSQILPADLGLGGPDDECVNAAGRGMDFCQAFESCVGEAAEHLSLLDWDDTTGPESNAFPKMTVTQRSVDPERACGLSTEELAWSLAGMGLSAGSVSDEFPWLRARSLSGRHDVFFPRELCVRPPPARRNAPRLAESNGCAAGPNGGAATLSALLEVIERDAMALWWYCGRPPRPIDEDLETDNSFRQDLDVIRGGGSQRPYRFLDLTTEIDIPVVAAFSYGTDGSEVVAGFAAGLNSAAAARSAFLEMCQMELAQEIALSKQRQKGKTPLQETDRLWIQRHKHLNFIDYPQFSGGRKSGSRSVSGEFGGLSDCVAQLENQGFRSYAVDLTRSQVGMPVVRVLVPGLQSPKADWISDRYRQELACNQSHMHGWKFSPAPI